MKQLKRSFILLLLLTAIIGSRTFAQDSLFVGMFFKADQLKKTKQDRAREVMQDNEYTITGEEKGIFLTNPLMLDGKPLDYGEFNIGSKGELTVNKGAPASGLPIQIPFYVYLRRDGKKILAAGKEKPDPRQTKIDVSEILRLAEPGDQLVIEAVRKEDGSVKRILKLIGDGC